MPVFDDNTINTITMVGNLNAMGEREAASNLGLKLLSELPNSSDAAIFKLAYDMSMFRPGEPDSLMEAVLLCALCKELYKQFRVISGGNAVSSWFKAGDNNRFLIAFFDFLRRQPRSPNQSSDAPILAGAIKALKGEPTMTIPARIGNLKLDQFLQGVANGAIRLGEGK